MTDEEYNEKKYKLEVYNALYKAYADEIRNLWQRSAFLGVFMTLAWGGYGALQLKMIEKCLQNICAYHFASLGLCAVIIVLSLLWIAMAKGSKFVQEAHEKHIEHFGFDKVDEIDIDIKKNKRLFCDLGVYNNKLANDEKVSVWHPLKPYSYSPSRINIFLGWLSGIASIVLGIIHATIYGCCGIFGFVCFITLCFWQILNKN